MPRGATLGTGFRNLPAVLADSRGLRRVAGTIARRFESSAPVPYGNQWGAVQAIACSGAMANSSRLSERPSRTSRQGMRTLYQGWLFVVGPREFPPTYAHARSRNDNDRALAHRVAMVLDQDPHGRHSFQLGHLDKPHDGWMRPATQKDEFPEVRVLGDQQALLLVRPAPATPRLFRSGLPRLRIRSPYGGENGTNRALRGGIDPRHGLVRACGDRPGSRRLPFTNVAGPGSAVVWRLTHDGRRLQFGRNAPAAGCRSRRLLGRQTFGNQRFESCRPLAQVGNVVIHAVDPGA